MGLILVTLVLWAAGCAHRGEVRIGWSPLYWPFLGLLVLASVQLLAGLNADHMAAREALLKIVTYFILFFLAGQLLNTLPESGSTLERFGLTVTLLAFALCALSLAQLLWGGGRMIYWTFPSLGSPFGPFVNHNNYAGLMEMLLPISVTYILSRSSNLILRFLLWGGVVLVIVSIWISGSRGGAVVLVGEGVLLAGILMWQRPRGVSPFLLLVLLGVGVVSAALFSWLVSTGRVGDRAWSAFETNRSLGVRLGDRFQVDLDTLRMARSHPWTGVGVGCFESSFPGFMTAPSDLHWTHAHDDVLEGLAETGLPGGVLIFVALVLFMRGAFRNIKGRLRSRRGWAQMGAAVGAMGLFLHSFVDFNLRVPANAAWFVVCLAVATHPCFGMESHKNGTRDSFAERNEEF